MLGAGLAGRYVDCHCHMTAEEFSQDIVEILERSRNGGVRALVSVTEHAGELESLLHLSERYPSYVMPCFGVHPIQSTADGYRSATLQDLEPALEQFEKYKDHLVGIGEIGLDFTPWLTPTSKEREEQLKVFQIQLDIAKRLDLPVNVHSRSAGRQTISFLKEQGAEKVLLHNFAGRPSVALEGVQAGYFFSFPPAVANNDQREKLIRRIPMENICLETDSPALGPDRQERNTPSNIFIPCEYIARVKGLSSDTVCEATAHNAFRLFPKIHFKLNE
ncbi:deoxyribonuclease TATDN3 isoform X1 [Ranitomeya variabilis]|uniref:deoxyribonuclease TATDN3 isoform X1 n=1 Tax=Ranitomeya variabilis TaxID=490064 RepID=UPI00405641F8